MSVGNVGSSLSSMQDRFKSFQSGKSNITKSDLEDIQSKFKSSGKSAPKVLEDLSKKFDKIDTNGDGISINELKSYGQGRGITIPTGFPPQAYGGEGAPKDLSKDDLVAMQSKMSQMMGKAPEGMDKLISNFDKYAGEDGKLSVDEFKSFADENGIKMPSGGMLPSSNNTVGEDQDPFSALLKSLGSSSDDEDEKNKKKSESESLGDTLKKFVSGKYSKTSSNYSNSIDLTQFLKQIQA